MVNRIMDAMKSHTQVSGNEGLQELEKRAVSFEEKVYIAATSQQEDEGPWDDHVDHRVTENLCLSSLLRLGVILMIFIIIWFTLTGGSVHYISLVFRLSPLLMLLSTRTTFGLTALLDHLQQAIRVKQDHPVTEVEMKMMRSVWRSDHFTILLFCFSWDV